MKEILQKEKNNSYDECVIALQYLDKSIENLGESSLKISIEQLQIKIAQTDGNYFDEVFEIKKALRSWLNIKSVEDLEISKEEIPIEQELKVKQKLKKCINVKKD